MADQIAKMIGDTKWHGDIADLGKFTRVPLGTAALGERVVQGTKAELPPNVQEAIGQIKKALTYLE